MYIGNIRDQRKIHGPIPSGLLRDQLRTAGGIAKAPDSLLYGREDFCKSPELDSQYLTGIQALGITFAPVGVTIRQG